MVLFNQISGMRGTSSRPRIDQSDDKRHIVLYDRHVKTYRWNQQKNETLKRSRGVSFEDVVLALEAGGLLEVVNHPNPKRYPKQHIFVLALAGYVYLVPYVDEESHVFLKTIIPSRKATRDYGEKGGV